MAEYLEYDWKTRMISHDIHINEIKEVHKKTSSTQEAIQALRALVHDGNAKQMPTLMQQDDATLLKFLYARHFNVPDTYQLLQKYHAFRQTNATLLSNLSLDAEDIRKAVENILPGVLAARDRKGRSVLILYASNWDCSYSLATIYRSILCVLEVMMRDVANQANGLVVIVDWTEFTLKQTANLKPSVLKLMIEGLQDAFPARFKGVHFIGQPWYVETALAVIKPFLKSKVKERIYVHGNNLSTLHDYLPKDILPTELGGDLGTHNPEPWIKGALAQK